MSEHSAIYDLGEIHQRERATAASRRRSESAAAAVARPSAVPPLAATAALFVPGSGHLLARDSESALFFASTLGCAAALCWALWQTLDPLLATLALLEVPVFTVGIAFIALYVVVAALHVAGVLDAYAAYLRACLPRRAHPVVAALASAVVPGWGQVLAGRRARGGVFLSMLWLLGAAWLVAQPLVRATFARVGLSIPVPNEVVDRFGLIVLLSLTGALWAVAVWDAAASRSDPR